MLSTNVDFLVCAWTEVSWLMGMEILFSSKLLNFSLKTTSTPKATQTSPFGYQMVSYCAREQNIIFIYVYL